MTSTIQPAPELSNAALERPLLTRQKSASRVLGKQWLAALVLLDSAAIGLAFLTAYLVRFRSQSSIFYVHTESQLRFYSTLVFLLIPLMLVIFAFYRLYASREIIDGPQEYTRIISAATLSMLLVVLLSFFFDGNLVISRGWIVISWVALILFVGGFRFLNRRLIYWLRSRGVVGSRVAMVAGGDDAQQIASRIAEIPASGLRIVSTIEPANLDSGTGAGVGQLRSFLDAHRVDEVIVSAASVPQHVLARIVRELAQSDTQLHLIPGMYEIQTTGVRSWDIHGLPLVTLNKVRITGFDFVLKRSLDYVTAGGALLLLSPLLLILAGLVKVTSPGPVFHRRHVIGERGKRFDALKFRTMRVDGDRILAERPDLARQLATHGKLEDDPRITRIGGFLRRWSLDELPQLINVLRGQMSLVGPRMITEQELDHFGHWRDNLVTVKPGLTGLWQISGRSRLGYDERVRLDMYYIRNYSIWRDLEILIRTVPAVLRGTGAY